MFFLKVTRLTYCLSRLSISIKYEFGLPLCSIKSFECISVVHPDITELLESLTVQFQFASFNTKHQCWSDLLSRLSWLATEYSSSRPVLPGPKTRKPPGFCQKKPRLAGRFSTSNFSRPVSRPSDKCLFLILFLSNLCYFMTSNVWYYDHLLISLQKLDRKVKHRFSKNWNLLKSR